MMSASTFTKRSAIFLHRRSSPIIKDIDKLMEASEQASTSPNRKIKCLVYIYMLCKQYTVTKPNGRRGDAIQDLLDEVRIELDSKETREQLQRKAAGEGYSKGLKVDKMNSIKSSMTSLDAAYVYEGMLPQRNFIAKMHLDFEGAVGSNEKVYGMSGITAKVELDTGMDNKAASAMLAKAKFSEVLDFLHLLWLDNTDSMGTFNYLNGEQRLQYMVSVENGRLINYVTKAPLTTSHPIPYAIDLNERIFALHDAKGVGISWNHSSMLSGAPVICAGEFKVAGGMLTEFDNNSGHYKPGTDNLVDAVKVLASLGLNLQTFKVQDKSKGTKYATGLALLNAARGGGNICL
jgi:hypothetical protein